MKESQRYEIGFGEEYDRYIALKPENLKVPEEDCPAMSSDGEDEDMDDPSLSNDPEAPPLKPASFHRDLTYQPRHPTWQSTSMDVVLEEVCGAHVTDPDSQPPYMFAPMRIPESFPHEMMALVFARLPFVYIGA